MQTLIAADPARKFVLDARARGSSVGIVPTMGALHDGHLSLIHESRKRCDETVVTIFVNPAQFSPDEDLDRYPRTLDRDLERLSASGVSALFLPTAQTMYPDGFSTFIDPPQVAKSLEGDCRSGHFRGVATVVLKIFNILPATHAFFGRKDYQQWKVIEAMARDLNLGIHILAVETKRESDGLALSSRNRFLSVEQRRRAMLIPESLDCVGELVDGGERNVQNLQTAMHRTLMGTADCGVDHIDYAVIVDAETLLPLDQVDRPAVALIAVRVGNTRLIDNKVIE